MARKKKSAESDPLMLNENGTAGGEVATKGRRAGRRQNGDSIQGYFRTLLGQHPEWVEMRSNEPIFQQWLVDNPGHTEVPQGAKNGLSNVKSSLRNKVRSAKKKRGRPRKVVAAGVKTAGAPAPQVAKVKVTRTMESLEALEEQIDEALSVAKRLGKEDLHHIIVYLKRARNAVVMKLGE